MPWSLVGQIILILFVIFILAMWFTSHYFTQRSSTYVEERRTFKKESLFS